MLHVILLILKILGIILLVILGLLLLVLYAVLFAAVSYRVLAERTDVLRVSASAGWLFRIFTVFFSFAEGSGEGPVLQIRLFGRPILRILGEEAPKRKRRFFRRRGRRRQKQDGRREETPQKIAPELEETAEEPEGTAKEETTDAAGREAPSGQAAPEPDRPKGPDRAGAKRPEKDRTSFFAGIFRRISGIFRRIRSTVRGIKKSLRKLRDRKDALLAFWNLEEHKRARGALWKEARYLWKKSRPKKIQGTITFGFADPAHTGLCMGAAGILCAWYPGQIRIVPDFEQEILRGDVKIRGRIRCYIFVRTFLRVWFHKDIRRMYQHWKEL